jgi:hypothetical protein
MLTKMADYFETSIDYLVGYTGTKREGQGVESYDLSADEAAMIEQYRTLSQRERESIRLVMENYLNR